MPYLTPEDVPEERDCRALLIPASSDWLAIFSGALTELTLKWNWEAQGITVAEALAVVNEVLEGYYDGCMNSGCETPDGYRVIRINENGELEQLEDGDWVPATDEYYIPPPAAREGGTPEDQICLAAANAVNVLHQLYESLSDSWNADLDENEAITAFIAALIALLGFAAAPITWAIAAFFLAVFKVLYIALEYLIADLWTEDFSNQMICFLVNCATNTDGVVTFDWNCFNSQLNSLADSFELTEIQLRLYAQVGYILYFIGGGDALNLAGATNEIGSHDCENCADEWCYIWDLTAVHGDWEINTGLAGFQPKGQWSIGVGFFPEEAYNPTPSDQWANILEFQMTLPAAIYRECHIEFDLLNGDGSLGMVYFGTDLEYMASGAADGLGTFMIDIPSATGGDILYCQWAVAFSNVAPPAFYGGLAVTSIQLKGIGENPFGEDNCEEE